MVFFHTRRDATNVFHSLEKHTLIECDIFPSLHSFSAANIEALVVYWDNLNILLYWAHPFCLIRGKKVEVFFSNEKQNDARVVLAQPRGPEGGGGEADDERRPEGLGQHHPSVILFEWEKKNLNFLPPNQAKGVCEAQKNGQIIPVNY